MDTDVAKCVRGLGKEFDVVSSPNRSKRKCPPTMLVIGWTGLNKEKAMINFNTGKGSTHYLVDRTGNVTQIVSNNHSAYCAGHGAWQGEHEVNTASLGVTAVSLGFDEKPPQEKEDKKKIPGAPEYWHTFEDTLVTSVGVVRKTLVKKYNIPPDRVIAHSDMSTIKPQDVLLRKVDPGPRFPWKKLYEVYGVGAWYDQKDYDEVVLPSAEEKEQWMIERLVRWGYPVPKNQEWKKIVRPPFSGLLRAVRVFQMHFRPKCISGDIDEETMRILGALLHKYGK